MSTAEQASSIESQGCKIVRTTVVANTTDESICYDGRSSNVSSGSMWGGVADFRGRDPIDVIREIVIENNEWLRTYENPDTGEKYKIPMKFINKVTLDGKEIAVSQESQGLNRWL
jgi:hypothetical protein